MIYGWMMFFHLPQAVAALVFSTSQGLDATLVGGAPVSTFARFTMRVVKLSLAQYYKATATVATISWRRLFLLSNLRLSGPKYTLRMR
jgi:hypothetical protein